MGTGSRWVATLVVACAMAFAGFCPTVAAQEDIEQQIVAKFGTAMDHYKAGEYAQAKDALDELLALSPGSVTVLELRNNVEAGQLAEMASRDELTGPMSRLVAMINEAVRQQKREVEHVTS